MMEKSEQENIERIKEIRKHLHLMEMTLKDLNSVELIGSIEECLDIIEEHIMVMQK